MRRILAAAIAACCLVALPAQQPLTQRHEGRVVDELGVPVAAAEIRAVRSSDGAVLARTFADAEGVWLLPRVPTDVLLALEARHAGKAVARRTAGAGLLPPRCTFELVDATTLSGVVADSAGAPIAGAVLVLSADPFGTEVVTDAQGSYRVDDVPLGRVTVRTWARGCEPRCETLLVNAPARYEPVLARSRVPARVVRVTGVAVDALAKVRIDVVAPAEGLPRALRSVPLRADGSAELWPLEGPHALFLSAPGYRGTPAGVFADGSARDVVFAAERVAVEALPTTRVHGRVADAHDRPLRDRVVQCSDASGRLLGNAMTAADGTFAIDVVLRGSAPARFALPIDELRPAGCVDEQGLVWTHAVVDLAAGVALRCEAAGALRGRAVDGAGNGLPFAPVYLLAGAVDWAPEPLLERRVLTDRSGMFDLRGVLPGEYSVVIAGEQGFGSADVRVAAGPCAPLPPIRCRAVGALAGTLRSPRGEPLAGARLVVHSGDFFAGVQPWWRRTGLDLVVDVRTDRLGRYCARGLLPGRWLVHAAGREPIEGEAEVAAGPATALDLQPAR